jgi:hypothetical protein
VLKSTHGKCFFTIRTNVNAIFFKIRIVFNLFRIYFISICIYFMEDSNSEIGTYIHMYIHMYVCT